MPLAIPLLTMIRLTEEIVTEIQKRRCPPAENFIFGIRIQMWPAFQKAMHDHIESMKKLSEGGVTYGYFSRAAPVTDATVTKVSYGESQCALRLTWLIGCAALCQLLQFVCLLDGT